MKQYLMKKRIALIMLLSFISFGIILLRMSYITFYLANDITPKALDLWSREIPTNSGRGKIYDRN